jgi:glycosyltransferase 2 family protein
MTKYLKTIFLIVIIYFFASYLYENWNKINEFKYETNWFCLGLSVLALLTTLFILPISFKNIVGLFNYDISLKKMTIILFCSQFAKYLPGGIWGYVGRVYLYRKEGMNLHDASKSVMLETLLVLLSGSCVSVFCLFFFDSDLLPKQLSVTYLRVTGVVFFVVLLVGLNPKVFNCVVRFVPQRFAKKDIRLDYEYIGIIKPSLYLICFWLGIGVSFWLLIKSVIPIGLALLPVTTGAFVLSWIIGILVFFTPGGLGAREVSMVVLLHACLPDYIAAFIAVTSRIWWVFGEFVWFIISCFWNMTALDRDGIIFRD